ncbi:uncharacterized protein LOC143267528 [Peromyscus maniculatus bairdii]|uniref:uncharacterized protein LOC143267528 n=1 Tax=Peromyscus maniculatus bairdii TaxID=230844 RepID=UPI003FD37EEC
MHKLLEHPVYIHPCHSSNSVVSESAHICTKHSSYVSFSIKISEIQSRGGDQLLRRTSTMPPEQVHQESFSHFSYIAFDAEANMLLKRTSRSSFKKQKGTLST